MQNYSTIIGVIELRQNGIGFSTIRRRYEIGSSTISLIMKRFGELRFTLDELRIMNPRDVESKFYPEENRRDTRKPLPDFFTIHEMMLNMKHPDLAFIWADYYKPKYPDGYQLTQFYKLYGNFLRENFGQENVKMPVERIPGEKHSRERVLQMRKKNDRDNQEFTIEETILIERLRSFRVPAMVEEYKRQLQDPNAELLSFQERFTRIVNAEWLKRYNKKFNDKLKKPERIPKLSMEA